MVTNNQLTNQPTNQVILEQASCWPVRRQSFAITENTILYQDVDPIKLIWDSYWSEMTSARKLWLSLLLISKIRPFPALLPPCHWFSNAFLIPVLCKSNNNAEMDADVTSDQCSVVVIDFIWSLVQLLLIHGSIILDEATLEPIRVGTGPTQYYNL